MVKERALVEQEKEELMKTASELVDKLKRDSEARDFLIDRRMINTFLVQFAHPKSDAKTKQHMLEAMSKILCFSIEEKQSLGLVQRTKLQDESKTDLKGVTSSLVNFLMGDDEFD